MATLLGGGVAQANDVGVLRAVVLGAQKTETAAVKHAAATIGRGVAAHNPHAVLAPLGTYIRAYGRAVRLITPTHGVSATAKRLKNTALAAFRDNLNGAVALRKSARAYIAGHRTLSNTLIRTYLRDFEAGRRQFKAAAAAERRLITKLGQSGPVTPLP
jgi:hypothetical protein